MRVPQQGDLERSGQPSSADDDVVTYGRLAFVAVLVLALNPLVFGAVRLLGLGGLSSAFFRPGNGVVQTIGLIAVITVVGIGMIGNVGPKVRLAYAALASLTAVVGSLAGAGTGFGLGLGPAAIPALGALIGLVVSDAPIRLQPVRRVPRHSMAMLLVLVIVAAVGYGAYAWPQPMDPVRALTDRGQIAAEARSPHGSAAIVLVVDGEDQGPAVAGVVRRDRLRRWYADDTTLVQPSDWRNGTWSGPPGSPCRDQVLASGSPGVLQVRACRQWSALFGLSPSGTTSVEVWESADEEPTTVEGDVSLGFIHVVGEFEEGYSMEDDTRRLVFRSASGAILDSIPTPSPAHYAWRDVGLFDADGPVAASLRLKVLLPREFEELCHRAAPPGRWTWIARWRGGEAVAGADVTVDPESIQELPPGELDCLKA